MHLISHSPAWRTLETHWREIADLRMRDLFEQDPERSRRFSLEQCGIYLDYSKNLVTEQTMSNLMALAKTADLTFWGDSLLRGDKVNNTEGRAVLHMALRNLGYRDYQVDGVDVMPAIRSVLSRMRAFSDDVRSGRWLGYTGQRITDVVRGADLLWSTPRQYWLQDALGYAHPRYAHVPLVYAGDGNKLSKRDDAFPVNEHDPVASLLAGWRHLGQAAPADRPRSASDFWQWAVPRWRIEQVPKDPRCLHE